ncbi:RNA polymerase subunit sigma-70 [Terrimonas sp.]|uniref:RNA polymerase sigma factor n=1 Tax=Terrimonas sp. TaxID=1914338 RepID=UPI000D52104F|nr:sigma-70 family RNA polymerase sigma factor [Terrimonas sp.]PVD49900.1 RNA polymerase subunit sigma-70 [Terrimonas sp.]
MSIQSNHTTTEADLIKGCIAGERRMQEILYQRFSPKMYAVCLRYANKAEDAQDILQDGFVKVFKNLHMYRGEGSFEGWIRRIFVNTAIEHYRRQVNLYPVTEGHENALEAKDLSALDSLNMKDLMGIIQELSPGYKTVFNLYVIEGYSHKEIAEMIGISEGTSKSQLARAKGILQNIIRTRLTPS